MKNDDIENKNDSKLYFGLSKVKIIVLLLIVCLLTFGNVVVFYNVFIADDSKVPSKDNTTVSISTKNDKTKMSNSSNKNSQFDKFEDFKFPKNAKSLEDNLLFVALYGTHKEPILGVLGHQDIEGAITRAKNLANDYQGLTSKNVYPTFEIITTIASSSPTDNNDYSSEISINELKPWVEKALKEDVYVVLDLQPGRNDFLTQAKQYESLLKYPNVGLAIDPEWRVGANERPMINKGKVYASEVNSLAKWLQGIIKRDKLPQKLFLMHEFRISMMPDQKLIDTSITELLFVIQMDGQGDQNIKKDTWQTIISEAPNNVSFGWKNFYTKDSPVLTPAQTLEIKPSPIFISYQ